MKRNIAVITLLVMAVLFVLSGCTGGDTTWDWKDEPKAASTGETINVYNWGEYIASDTNRAFTHLTGIKVNYSTYDENESLYAKMKSGAVDYDVIIPSDYMIGRMIKENMLQKLDYGNIPNAKYIDSRFDGGEYDPGNAYSIPYTWGTVGIFYNKKYVKEEDLAQGWDLLWDEDYKGKIIMFNNSRDAFAIALKKLGYSMNTTNTGEWEKAYGELVKQKPLLYQYAMDETFDIMISEEAHIAPYYAGDGIIMMDAEEGNTNIDFFFPHQGTNWFVDAMCIPTGAKNKEAAEKYINFMCRTEVAKANAEYIGYSTPHTDARDALDPEISNNPYFYAPEDVLEKAQLFITLPDSVNGLMDSLWNQLKKK